MERTPWPEIGQEWGRTRSVTRVSTQPFPQVLQVHKTVLSMTAQKLYLLQRTLSLLLLSLHILTELSETRKVRNMTTVTCILIKLSLAIRAGGVCVSLFVCLMSYPS